MTIKSQLKQKSNFNLYQVFNQCIIDSLFASALFIMDPLTPNKIKQLLRLAQNKSFTPNMLFHDQDVTKITSSHASCTNLSPTSELSSGILDVHKLEGFGETGNVNQSLSKSTAFNPGEMTGRSTGTDDVNTNTMNLIACKMFEEFGRHSLVLDSITSQMDKQTSEVHDIMRHSIATNYSFHSKRDLTADEASLVMRETPLHIKPGNNTNFTESTGINNSNLSVGSYFKKRCPEFNQVLSATDSPVRSLTPSIAEVSTNATFDIGPKHSNCDKLNQPLDSVPVKQPRSPVNKKQLNYSVSNNKENQNNLNLLTNPKDPHLTGNKRQTNVINVPTSIMGCQKSFMNATPSKPTDVFIRNLQSVRMVADETEGSVENSLSISKIADFLGKQSSINVSVTDMLQLTNKTRTRKVPEVQLNQPNPNDRLAHDNVPVTKLIDTKNMPTGSSTGSINTVISLDKLKIGEEDLKAGEFLSATLAHDEATNDTHSQNELSMKLKSKISKSSSSKSPCTLSTVHENFPSFKSGDSPLTSRRGESKTSHLLSPNIQYKELDKSVDWHEVLLQKQMNQAALAKEEWVEISATSINGFVGVSCPVTISITTQTDSWLTAKFYFEDSSKNKDLSIEFPKQPFLLSPRKTEQFTLHLTSLVELNCPLTFKLILRDASVDRELEQNATIEASIKMPGIQAMSCDGVNKVNFPAVTENNSVIRSVVLLSDSPVDLHLELSIAEGDSLFYIKNAQEVRKSEINKVLMERHGRSDAPARKHRTPNVQFCRLSKDNGIKVTIVFNAPELSELKIMDKIASFSGVLNVSLMGVKVILRKIELISVVGTLNLVVNISGNNCHLTATEPTTVSLLNTGTIPGIWTARFADSSQMKPIKMSPTRFELRPGVTKTMSLYAECGDIFYQNAIIFEEITSGVQTELKIGVGADKPKVFSIKTNHCILSWVRSGRKELSLKNTSDYKVHVKCQIVGAGFSIDLPGGETRGTYVLPFGPHERRTVPIVFNPNTYFPHSATLHLVYDRNSDVSRKVKLYGCLSGDMVRWSGLATYGDTALVRAALRAPVVLQLYNKAPAPAFICARVQFNRAYSNR
ncbi:hypothetical protein ACJJTC_000527 [Scirpophaga incertulas]